MKPLSNQESGHLYKHDNIHFLRFPNVALVYKATSEIKTPLHLGHFDRCPNGVHNREVALYMVGLPNTVQ